MRVDIPGKNSLIGAPMVDPVFRMVGESALLVELGDHLDLEINCAVQRFDRAVTNKPITGVIETAPTLRSLLIRFDPLIISWQVLQQQLLERLQGSSEYDTETVTRRWRIPACYGAANECELSEVAALLNLSVEQVIEEHSQFIHRVLTLGFAPGFLYLGILPAHWHIPRLEHVKAEVPAGSISVAVGQTVVTSTPIPTGWRTIGITPFSNFNLADNPPFSVVAGDEIQFYPVDTGVFKEMQQSVAAGESVAEFTAV